MGGIIKILCRNNPRFTIDDEISAFSVRCSGHTLLATLSISTSADIQKNSMRPECDKTVCVRHWNTCCKGPNTTHHSVWGSSHRSLNSQRGPAQAPLSKSLSLFPWLWQVVPNTGALTHSPYLWDRTEPKP